MKQSLLTVAELADAFRVLPRIILVGYGLVVIELVHWAMNLPSITVEQAGLVSIVTAMFAPLSNWYMQTGRKWNGHSG